RIQGRHTASNLAGELMNTITETGIGDRVCSVTSDAASVNIKMMKLIEQKPGTIIHVLCVGHKLHLSVTNGLGLWSCKTIDEDDTRSSQQTEDSSSDEDGDPDDILAEAESDSDAEDIDESSDLAWSRGVETTDDRRCRQWGVALLKARANGRLLRQSSVASSLLSECMRAEGIVRQRVCPRDINIRWNSTYRMVQWYVEYRPVFSLFQTRCQALPKSDNLHKHFRKFALTVPDFESLQNLASVLCHFEDATRLFSGSSYCTLSLIRPVVKGLLQKCSGAGGRSQLCRIKDRVHESLNNYFKFCLIETDSGILHHACVAASYLHPAFADTEDEDSAQDSIRKCMAFFGISDSALDADDSSST
ncbi:hypothetical protein Pmar_PMAR000006, partial [Perkinsus marinus ATCC 50983]